MKKSLKLFFVLTTIVLFFSCQKEEITYYSTPTSTPATLPIEAKYVGKWQLKSAYLNGIDYTNNVYGSLTISLDSTKSAKTGIVTWYLMTSEISLVEINPITRIVLSNKHHGLPMFESWELPDGSIVNGFHIDSTYTYSCGDDNCIGFSKLISFKVNDNSTFNLLDLERVVQGIRRRYLFVKL
jgi:hypothetical protein